MARQIAPGVWVVDVPATPDYKDSRAGGYTSIHTAQRWDNWQLALKQAELTYKDAASKAEAKRKMIAEAMDDLDKQIAYNQRQRDDWNESGATASERVAQKNIEAMNSADRWRAGQAASNARQADYLDRAFAKEVVKTTGNAAKAADDARQAAKNYLFNPEGAAVDIFDEGDVINSISSIKQQFASPGLLSTNSKIAATNIDDAMSVLRDTVYETGDPNLIAAFDQEAPLFDSKNTNPPPPVATTEETPVVPVPPVRRSAGGLRNPREVTVDEAGRAQIGSDYDDKIEKLLLQRAAYAGQYAGVQDPSTDLIGNARRVFADNFGNKNEQTIRTEADQIGAAQRIVKMYQDEELAKLPANPSIEQITDARELGATVALERLRGRTYKPAQAPTALADRSLPAVESFNEEEFSFDPPEAINPRIRIKPKQAQASLWDSIMPLPVAPASIASVGEPDRPRIGIKPKPPEDDFEFGSSVGKMQFETEETAAPMELEEDVIQGTTPGNELRPKSIPKAEDATLEGKAAPKSTDQKDREARMLAVKDGVTMKPKEAARKASNTSYGPITKKYVDVYLAQGDKAGSIQEAQDGLVTEFANDPTAQKGALALFNSLVWLEKNKGKIG